MLALLLAAVILLPVTARGAEPESTEYDGYLIEMADRAAPKSGSLEQIAPNVYLTEDKGLAEALLESGLAECVEPNYLVSLCSAEGANQPYEAVGGPVAAEYGLDGRGVRIAVIDSGVDADNANLTGAAIAEGYDYIRSTVKMTDTVGHGTCVCQIIAGSGDRGVRGLARGAEIVPLRCFSSTEGSLSEIISAVYDAVDKYHCDIINMSWGFEDNSRLLEKALTYACDAGVVLVAAAGNVSSKYPQGTVLFPAVYPNVIGVGYVDGELSASETSQHTAAVTVCAPGNKIAMASLTGASTAQSGTSFAAPYVSAELALLKQLAPGLDGDTALSLLRERAVDLGEAGYDTSYGYGFARFPELLGQSFGLFRTEENALTLEGWLKSEDGGVIAASYDVSGRMLSCRAVGAAGKVSPYRFIFTPAEETYELRLFYTDSACSPAAGKDVFVTESPAE